MPQRMLRPISSLEDDVLHLRRILENRRNAEALRIMDMLRLDEHRIALDRETRHAVARELRDQVED